MRVEMKRLFAIIHNRKQDEEEEEEEEEEEKASLQETLVSIIDLKCICFTIPSHPFCNRQ